MKLHDVFKKYFDMAIMGFIGGYVVYSMSEWSEILENKLLLAAITFLILTLLVFVYSFCIWFFNKK